MAAEIPLRHRTTTVDVVIYPGFKAIEAVGVINVFDYANARLAAAGLPPVYDLQIAAPAKGAVKSDTLIVLEATKAIDTLAVPDTAIVVGARDIERALRDTSMLVGWCRDVAGRIGRMVGLCSGCFFLAESGMLDGRRATTHWSVTHTLQARYPAVKVEPDAIFVREGNVWTSAGVTAGLDLALAMVEEDLGRDIALAVARDLVIYLKRPGGQSQFSVYLASQMTAHSSIRDVQDWILNSLGERLSVAQLAKRAAMSERNFIRVFVRETGYRPAEFIEIARLEKARRMLEQEELPLKTVAVRSGFHSDDQLRRVFVRRLGVTPGAYRERFSGTGVRDAAASEGADFTD